MKFDAPELAARQTELTARWHQAAPLPADAPHLPDDGQDKSRAGSSQQRESTGQTPVGPQPTTVPATGDGFFRLLEENHRRNFSLWHEEDIARRDDLGFERVYQAKRNIDRFNQERNNFAEEMDKSIVAALHPPLAGCPRNSETPGMMIDRLSILALKEYHMQEETVRPEASAEHKAKCAGKLARIRQQRADLTGCLSELIADVIAQRRTFSAYFQFKMYNDPALNPQLYRHAPKSGGA